MNYIEVIKDLESLKGHDIDSNISVMRELMRRLDGVQDKVNIIHVAGTNGKGSTCLMLSKILKNNGFKTGLFISPHLIDYTERISINGRDISKDDFIKYYNRVKSIADEMNQSGFDTPSFFEVLTAMAFCYFYDNGCDIAVIEVGLGGRYDSTNIIKKPLVSVIASISKDHTEFLGNTIEEIAFEKAGIIKNNVPTVLYKQGSTVYELVKDICLNKNSQLIYSEELDISIKNKSIFGSKFDLRTKFYEYKDLELSLSGEHQIKNCALVLLVIYVLRKIGYNIYDYSIYEALRCAKWPGRLEVIDKNPITIFDGAHNEDGIKILSDAIIELKKEHNITLVIGILSDKNYEQMAKTIMPLADKIFITRPFYSRALDENILAKLANGLKKEVHIFHNPFEAYDFARMETDKEDILICSGSLYLIGDLKRYLSR